MYTLNIGWKNPVKINVMTDDRQIIKMLPFMLKFRLMQGSNFLSLFTDLN